MRIGVPAAIPMGWKSFAGSYLRSGYTATGAASCPHVTHDQRVPVRRRLRRTRARGGAASADRFLHHQLLPERPGHVLAHDAGHHVGGPARGERDDEGDRSLRVVVCALPQGGNASDDGKPDEQVVSSCSSLDSFLFFFSFPRPRLLRRCLALPAARAPPPPGDSESLLHEHLLPAGADLG